jgi:hypothetical protein
MGIKILNLVLLFSIGLSSQIVFALSVETHEYVNENIANGKPNGFSFFLDSYLKNNLDVKDGINRFSGLNSPPLAAYYV